MTPSKGGSKTSLPTAPSEIDLGRLRRARNVRRVFLAIIALVVLGSLITLFRPRTASESASAGGYRLSVTYPAATRSGLAVRWIVEVSHPGGFHNPLTIATDSGYFNLFDFNNLDPVPTSQTVGGHDSYWTFDPPIGDVFRVTMDARLEPAQQYGKSATTAFLIKGVPIVRVHYTTVVFP